MEFVQCRLCGRYFADITHMHLKAEHDGMTVRQYQEAFPEADTRTDELRRAQCGGQNSPESWTPERRAQASKTSSERWTPELRERQSEKALAAHARMDPETRRKWMARCTHIMGRPSKETIEKLSEARREFFARETPEEKEVRCEAASIALTGYHPTETARRHMSEGTKAMWARMDSKEKSRRIGLQFDVILSGKRGHPNQCEAQLWKFLEQFFPGIFIPDWIERADIGGKHPDFRTGNGHKLIIESFGSYWHGPTSDRPTEEELVALYKEEGYDCLVIWADYPEDVIYEWPGLAGRIEKSLVSSRHEI